MKALKAGPNVVVALGNDTPTTYPVDYQAIPGRGELLARLMNPFSRRPLPSIPGIFQVITGIIFSLQTLIQPMLLSVNSVAGIAMTNVPRSNYLFLVHVFNQFFYYQHFGYGAALLWVFGDKIRDFIEERLMLVTTAFAAVLVGGFFVLRYL